MNPIEMPNINFTRLTVLLLVSTYIVPRTLATSTNQFSIKGGATEQSKPKQSTYRSSRRLLTCAGGSTNDCPSTEICQSATCTSCEWPLFPSLKLDHKGYVMRRLLLLFKYFLFLPYCAFVFIQLNITDSLLCSYFVQFHIFLYLFPLSKF